MAAPITSLAPSALYHDLQSALLTNNLTTLESGVIVGSLETLKKESSPDEAYYVKEVNLSGVLSSESRSARSSPATWSYFPYSQVQSDADVDTEETPPPFYISHMRNRSSRTDVARRARHWTLGALAVLGGLLAMAIALHQLITPSPALKKAAASVVSLGSSHSDQTNATAAGTSETAPEPPESIQGSETSKITGKRQWLLGVLVLAFALVFAAFIARLETYFYDIRRWLQTATSKRLPQHPTVEEELAELYLTTGERLKAEEDFAGSDPTTLTAVRKSFDYFSGLYTRTLSLIHI